MTQYVGYDMVDNCWLPQTLTHRVDTTIEKMAELALQALDELDPILADRDWDQQEICDEIGYELRHFNDKQHLPFKITTH